MMIKRVWKIYKGTSKATKERLLGFVLLGAVLVANLSPIFAQALDSPVLRTPLSNSICGFGTQEQSALLSGGECNNGFLTGICGSIIEPISTITTGNTGYDIACAGANLAKGDTEMLSKILDSSSEGIIGGLGTATAMLLQQRPLSGIDYIENQVYALTNPGQVAAQEPPAYYRGTGFDLLRPMQSFWGWSVNIVYALMILIVIFVAFGIIFKTSLNGGVVVALQSAIPNIVLAMILVPLSYAITGLFVDGITVGVNVVHQFLIGNGSPGNEIYKNRNEEFPLGSLIATTGSSDPVADGWDRGLYVDDIRLNWIYVSTSFGFTEKLRPGIISVASVFGWQDFISAVTNNILGDILMVLVNFVMGAVLLWTGARIAWLLAGKFVVFLVGPLFAPFIFATVALPSGGTKMIFSYLKSTGAASLYYVVAYAMFLLSMILASDYILVQAGTAATPIFTPPLIGLEQLSGPTTDGTIIPQGLVGIYLTVASLVIYMLIPSTLKKIDAMLGVNDGGIMAIFNDVKKSVTDSVGMAKMWNKQVVGRAGKAANFASVLTTGRKLNGPDGWGTNQYKRIGGNIRQAGSRLRNSNNILARAVGAASALTVEAGLTGVESVIGGEGSSTRSMVGGKNAKITAEFKGDSANLPIDPSGNITITKEGVFQILAHYGLTLSPDGDIEGTGNFAQAFVSTYKLAFKIEGGVFSDVVKPSDISFALAVSRSAASRTAALGGGGGLQGYNVAQAFKAGYTYPDGLNIDSIMPGVGNIFGFAGATAGLPLSNRISFLVSGGNVPPYYQTANKTSFQIKFDLKFEPIDATELRNMFGSYNKTTGSFVPFIFPPIPPGTPPGTPRPTPIKITDGVPNPNGLESRKLIFKLNNTVVNGDMTNASPLQVTLSMK